ncbi:phospholipase C, partial [Balamuthia mandrillaris]
MLSSSSSRTAVLLLLVLVASLMLVSTRTSSATKINAGTGTLQDLQHIVIFMQENRAFDHYYGNLNGVRGFNDRAHPRLPNGRPIFYQPAGKDSYILPFNLQFDRTSAQCMPAPQMAYESDIMIFNGGKMDAWNTARDPGFGMSFFNRSDLPWYYALADAFTIGDQYFQSTFTATNPNRQHLFTGSNGLSAPNSQGVCSLDDSEYKPGFMWETMAETLLKAGVSWRVIQEVDNFDDNAFEWFNSFQQAKPGSPLYELGIRPVDDLVQAFEDMVSKDSLPSVLWIVGPTALSEHAENHPGDGEDLSNRLISVLGKPQYKSVYAKTAFILNYDEGGQFFDHHWTPTPPRPEEGGKSTVTTVGELTVEEEFDIPPGNPIGLGFRVPLIIVSPWTRGHYVYSEISDHTSVIKLIEKRFGVRCPNISPWRRAIVSDLTAAFDFSSPDYSWPTALPDTSQNVNKSKWECDNLPAPRLPEKQSMPTQEPGTRLSRPLPYEFLISDQLIPSSSSSSAQLSIKMNNTGAAGTVFFVYNLLQPNAPPRKYAIEGGKWLSDEWTVDSKSTGGMYNLSMHGPNGFVRQFAGSLLYPMDASSSLPINAFLSYDKPNSKVNVVVYLFNTNNNNLADEDDAGTCTFKVVDNAYNSGGPWILSVDTNSKAIQPVSVAASGNWYDLTITFLPSSSCPVKGVFSRRFMGRMENGKITTSDPAMATGESPFALSSEEEYEDVPEEHQVVEKWTMAKQCASRRSQMKDACWD